MPGSKYPPKFEVYGLGNGTPLLRLGPCLHFVLLHPERLSSLCVQPYGAVRLQGERGVVWCKVMPSAEVGLSEAVVAEPMRDVIGAQAGISSCACPNSLSGPGTEHMVARKVSLKHRRGAAPMPAAVDIEGALKRSLIGFHVEQDASVILIVIGQTYEVEVSSVEGPASAGLVSQETLVHYEADDERTQPHLATEHQDVGPLTFYSPLGGLQRQLTELVWLVEMTVGLCEQDIPSAVLPEGILLCGPSGVGKSLLLDALGSQCASLHPTMAVFRISGPTIISRTCAGRPALDGIPDVLQPFNLILVDEACAIAVGGDESDAADKRETLLSAASFLKEIDFVAGQRGVRIAVVGASRLSSGKIASSILSRRFDKCISVPVPCVSDRQAILLQRLEGEHVPSDVAEDWAQRLTLVTPGYTGGDINRLIRLADSHWRARSGANLEWGDFEAATREVVPAQLRGLDVSLGQGVNWSDVGGFDEVKKKLRRAVEWPWKHNDSMQRLNVAPPSGILLHGPSGCGKSLLAQVVASECRANFIWIRSADLLSPYLGESEEKVRNIFAAARQASPSVLFLDELDSITASRESGAGSEGQSVYLRVLSTLLNEMDGVTAGATNAPLVLGATNRKHALDAALLRPGRLSEQIYVGVPCAQDREAIFSVHIRGMPIAPDVDPAELADDKWTGSMTCAQVKAVCTSAAILLLREGITESEGKVVERRHFLNAIENTRRG